MKKSILYLLLAAAGAALLIGGAVWLRFGVDNVAAYVCIGVGAGMLGHGLGGWLQERALRNAPETRRRLEIETTDECNLALSCRAKAKAYDAMVYIFSALMLVFALMQVDLAAILLLVVAYLTVCGIGVYYRLRYEKEM